MACDWLDLPQLTIFTTGDYSFEETTSVSLESIKINFSFHSDVPFTNGTYTHGHGAFYNLQSSGISSDTSRSSFCIFELVSTNLRDQIEAHLY